MPAEKYTADQMIRALTETHGMKSAAARALHCSRRTVDRYIDNYPTVREAYEDAREIVLDMAEAALFREIQNGNITAIIFTLKTVGKHRGYVERQELTGADGGAVPLEIVLKQVAARAGADD
jgi:hypothetical protein